MSDVDVLVVGAGLAGLHTATLLARAGGALPLGWVRLVRDDANR